MEKLKQIVESGELRQVLEHRFSNVVVDAVIEKVSERKSRKCNHAAKLQAAEEMAKLLQTVKKELAEMDTPWSNRLVKLIASEQVAWEKAGKGK